MDLDCTVLDREFGGGAGLGGGGLLGGKDAFVPTSAAKEYEHSH